MNQKTTTQELKLSKTYVFSVLFMPSLMFCILVYYNFINPDENTKSDIVFSYIIMLLLILGEVTYLWYAKRFRVFLNEEFIALETLFTKQKILVQDLAEYRMHEGGIHIYIKKYVTTPMISISTNLDHLDLLYSWLQKHSKNPELEAEIAAQAEEMKNFLIDDKYGKNIIEKEENLAIVRKVARYLNGLSWFVFVWIFVSALNFYPIPYIDLSCFIAMSLPVILVYFMFRYKGFFNVDVDAKIRDGFPNIYFVLHGPSIGLGAYWVFSDWYVLDVFDIWVYTLLMSLMVTIPTLYLSRDLKFKKISNYVAALLIFFMMLGYSYGTVAYLNYYYDESETEIFQVEVLSKKAGKSKDDADHITLAPWHEQLAPTEIEVRQYLFDQTKEGEEISIYLSKGALGIQYYAIVPNE